MAQVQLQKLSPKHEAIMNWILENPEKPRRECAAFFGVTETWLSIIINSHCFQARLHERQEVIFSVVASDIPTKLRGVASLALDRVGEALPVSNAEFALDVMDKTLKNLGFTPSHKPGQPPAPGGMHFERANVFVASSEQLEDARALMARVGVKPQGALIDVTGDPAPEAT
jgi:hypothetical protein